MDAIMSILDTLGDKLGTMASSELVIGEPIVLGKVTVVTLSRVGLSLGAGGGEGEGMSKGHKGGKQHGKGRSTGAGMGAKLRPVAVVLFTPDGVKVHEIPDKKGPVEKILDKIPEIVEMVEEKVRKGEE